MLQSKRNQETLGILSRLRKQGMPSVPGAIPMGLGVEGEGDEDIPAEGPMGDVLVDMTIPGGGQALSLAKKLKKKKQEEEV